MGDDDHSDGQRVVHSLQEADDVSSRCGIKIACRLVRQNQGGAADQGAGHRHALTLPARQLFRLVMQAVRQTNTNQFLFRAAATFAL